MQNAPSLSPLLTYDPLPLWLAAGLLALVCCWYGLVFYLTRKKHPKVLATLPPAPPVAVDLSSIKQHYLTMIDAIEASFNQRQLQSRAAHQELSALVRQFASEVEKMSIKTMTLSDLKKSRFASLTPVIEAYYPPEFASLDSGSVASACGLARTVVQQW